LILVLVPVLLRLVFVVLVLILILIPILLRQIASGCALVRQGRHDHRTSHRTDAVE
jgi:hypothetical protein